MEKCPFPNQLRKYRIQKGLTIDNIAEILSCSKKDITQWEKGEAVPPIAIAFEVCAIYGITPEIAYGKLYKKLKTELKRID